jgi:HK97 gp10 family phage protein
VIKVRASVAGVREGSAATAQIAASLPSLLSRALRDPMKDVLAEARMLVPKRFGLLHDALDLTATRTGSSRGTRFTDRLAEVGLRIKNLRTGLVGHGGQTMRPRSYWHLVEFGTAHSPAHPFIRPAFDRNAKGLVEKFTRIMREGIERATKKARRASVGQYRGTEDE